LSEAERLGRAPHICPVVPLRNLVAFPHTILPLHIGRKKSVNALAVEDVAAGRKPILLVTQKNNDTDPSPEAIYRMGVPRLLAEARSLLFRPGSDFLRHVDQRIDFLANFSRVAAT
jgi:ATP-dependent Lon protease